MANHCALNRIFRALADPTRRFMVECLCNEDASVSWLAEPLPISLGSVLKHVRALERDGLIRTHKIGRVRTCWLEPQALDLLDRWVRFQRGRYQRRQPRT